MAGLKDIAEATGVSVRTVSRALKGNGYVSDEVRKSVLEVARKLNYRPNRLAQSLKTNRSYEVLALAWSIDELHAEKIRGLEVELRKNNYRLSLLTQSDDSSQRAGDVLIDEVMSRSPAGVVIIGASFPWQYDIVNKLAGQGMSCIILDTPYADVNKGATDIPGVYLDRQSGVYDSIHYLYSCGCRRIMYAGLEGAGREIDQTRLKGYKRAVTELGLPEMIGYFYATQDKFCLDGEIAAGQFVAGRCAADEILKMRERPDAVQAFTDVMALGLLDGFHKAGVRIPEDIAVVGFDNRSASIYSSPPLTTVAQPSREVGRAAAQMFLDIFDGSTPAPQSRILPTSLIERESCRVRATGNAKT